jgi:hypothetical protein
MYTCVRGKSRKAGTVRTTQLSALSYFPLSERMRSSIEKGIAYCPLEKTHLDVHVQLTCGLPISSSSAFEKAVTFLPSKIDLPSFPVTPTRALDVPNQRGSRN